jgi:hypothetical protein
MSAKVTKKAVVRKGSKKKGHEKPRAKPCDVTAANLPPEADEISEASMFEWALKQFVTGKHQDLPETWTVDMSAESHEEKLQRALLDAVFWDGGAQYFERIESKAAREAIAWAATTRWPRVLFVFRRLLDVMVDVMDRAAAGDDPRELKAAERFANEMAGMLRTLAKYESGEWRPTKLDKTTAAWMGKSEAAGEPERVTDRLWLNPIFQQARKGMKGGRRISSTNARFAEFVVENIIGHKQANALINGRELVLYGVEWRKPRNQQEFDNVRGALLQASFEHLDVLVTYFEEDDQAGAASKVRGLKSLKDYRRYWREQQLDEAFRAYFGLTKARKK